MRVFFTFLRLKKTKEKRKAKSKTAMEEEREAMLSVSGSNGKSRKYSKVKAHLTKHELFSLHCVKDAVTCVGYLNTTVRVISDPRILVQNLTWAQFLCLIRSPKITIKVSFLFYFFVLYRKLAQEQFKEEEEHFSAIDLTDLPTGSPSSLHSELSLSFGNFHFHFYSEK